MSGFNMLYVRSALTNKLKPTLCHMDLPKVQQHQVANGETEDGTLTRSKIQTSFRKITIRSSKL